MATCKSCGAESEWIKTKGGTSHCIDAQSEKRWVETRDVCVTDAGESASYRWNLVETYISHVATCPESKEWSGKGGKT